MHARGINGASGCHGLTRMPVSSLHEEAVELVVEYGDIGDPLYPAIAGPAGCDEAQRKTVRDWQCFAVHFIREKSIAMESLRRGDGPLKLGHGANRNVGSVEEHVLSAAFYLGAREHISEPDARPPAISDAAIRPLRARDGWFKE